jgi:serine/threonine protein kinase/formylglycine-generating enzyme required for sulfatase activity
VFRIRRRNDRSSSPALRAPRFENVSAGFVPHGARGGLRFARSENDSGEESMGAEKTPDQDRDSNGREQEDSFVRAWGLLARFLDDHTLSDASSVERFIAEHPADERALREMLRNFHTNRVRNDRDDDDDDAIAADDGGDSDPTPALVDLLHRIRADIGAATRYTRGERIGSGGVGVVFKLWDANLRRNVAKKTIRVDKLRPDSVERFRWIARFLEEAQITAQLDHPGIVPVHDMGFEPDGQVYFTMRYVRGDTFADALDKARAGNDGWNRTRAVSTLLRVCETMAFAHGKDVIHRDLKPSNIMVGRYGETYVMDWGLARKLGKPDLRDLRIRPPQAHSTDVVTDARRPENAGLFTVDGHALGTPTYMSPEQARGEIDRLGKPTDIYALGAILYEILAGHPPYAEPGVRAPAETICRWVIDGPPAKLHTRAPDAPAELVAICERAMARDPDRRYPSVDGMADDLRAFLEHRVVKAYRTGPITELTKWVGRNRLAAAIAAALGLSLTLGGTLVVWSTWLRLEAEQARSLENQVSAIRSRVSDLLADAKAISPLDPRALELISEWTARSTHVLALRPTLRAILDGAPQLSRDYLPIDELPNALREAIDLLGIYERRLHRALAFKIPASAEEPKRFAEITKVTQDLAILPEVIDSQCALIRELSLVSIPSAHGLTRSAAALRSDATESWLFANAADAFSSLELIDDPLVGAAAKLGRLRTLARFVEDQHYAANSAWTDAVRSIASIHECPTYKGMRISPVRGLVPIRRDPRSGLWEFWHVASGDAPTLGPDNEYEIRPETGIVLILMPEDIVWMGLQSAKAGARFYYPTAQAGVVDRHEVRLDPFFIGKYETTQSQWVRIAGTNPSAFFVGYDSTRTRPLLATHPVESIDHDDADTVLPRWGLSMPTEAQWLSCTGLPSHHEEISVSMPDDEELLPQCENLFYHERFDPVRGFDADCVDGYVAHAPVGSYPPNKNGIHDLMGNVSELCADYMLNGSPMRHDLLPATRIGARRSGPTPVRVISGPNFRTVPNRFGSIDHPTERALRRGSRQDTVGIRVAINLPALRSL